MNYSKFFLIFFLLFLVNCSTNIQNIPTEINIDNRFSNKGFALVYNVKLYEQDIINKKIDNRSNFIFHKNLKRNSSVKITNLLNNKSIIAKVKSNKIKHPIFFNSVISERIAEDLELDLNEPYVQISLISNNSSFIAKKTKTWEEEREVAEKAPVDGIVINDLNEKKTKKTKKEIKKFSYSIKIADFYYKKSASDMLKRIRKETGVKKIKVVPLSKTKFRVILGPFNDINSLKNSYNKTTVLNFENLEIIRND